MRSDTVVLPASMWSMMPMLRRKASFWLRAFLAGGTVALLMAVPKGGKLSAKGVAGGPGIACPLFDGPGSRTGAEAADSTRRWRFDQGFGRCAAPTTRGFRTAGSMPPVKLRLTHVLV